MGEYADNYDWLFERMFEEWGEGEDEGVTCNRCGASNLYWKEVAPDKWRLYTAARRMHECPPKDVSNVTEFIENLK